MRYILLCRTYLLICFYSSQQAVFRSHLLLTSYLISQVIILTLPMQKQAPFKTRALTTVALEAVKFKYVYMSIIKAGHFLKGDY